MPRLAADIFFGGMGFRMLLKWGSFLSIRRHAQLRSGVQKLLKILASGFSLGTTHKVT
jgi:hypothetical protein